MTAYLILENGTVFEGGSFGARGDVTGEVVFATGMSGYLETLTDPSYYGQIVLQTFPLIGNYGVIPADFESRAVGAKAYIVKHPCQNPSNFRSEGVLGAFLRDRGIVGLCGIDTRALTRMIRANGVMNGKITASPPTAADLAEARAYSIKYAVAAVSRRDAAPNNVPRGGDEGVAAETRRYSVALMDFGAKRGIAEELAKRDCGVRLFPYDASAGEILRCKPDGVMLSNGPGDPADPANDGIVETVRALHQSGVPVFGICLGHQLLALANGYATRKLKFGHRGANQPVREVSTGRVYITSQNHGYAVAADAVPCLPRSADGLGTGAEIPRIVNRGASFVNVNDGTCEGLDYGVSFSVQFHPEARGGPRDTAFLFDRFTERMAANRR